MDTLDAAVDRFFDKVDADSATGCWVWTSSLDHSGYGLFWYEGKSTRAHRLVYEWMVGQIPEGLQINHLCNNRKCVNPAHLEIVTIQENNAYMVAQDRQAKGEDNHSKLTEEQVMAIRTTYAAGGTSHRKLAREYSVSHSVIGRIIRHEKWSYLKEES